MVAEIDGIDHDWELGCEGSVGREGYCGGWIRGDGEVSRRMGKGETAMERGAEGDEV